MGKSEPRCMARDGRDVRCDIRGEHQEVVNSKGQKAIVHWTEHSMWSTPIHDLQVVNAMPQDPMAIGAMLDRARHATPEDVAAGGANNEEELLIALRTGYVRGVEGQPGVNDLGFVMWPNGVRAFNAGYEWAQRETVQAMLKEALDGQRQT